MVLAVDGTADLAIDEPLDLIRGPVDLVGVVVVEGVRELGNVARVVVCPSRRQHCFNCNHHDTPSLGRKKTHSRGCPGSTSWSAQCPDQHRQTHNQSRP